MSTHELPWPLEAEFLRIAQARRPQLPLATVVTADFCESYLLMLQTVNTSSNFRMFCCCFTPRQAEECCLDCYSGNVNFYGLVVCWAAQVLAKVLYYQLVDAIFFFVGWCKFGHKCSKRNIFTLSWRISLTTILTSVWSKNKNTTLCKLHCSVAWTWEHKHVSSSKT